MSTLPRARFLPKNPPLILPRQRSRKELILSYNAANIQTPRQSLFRKWGDAFVFSVIVILVLAFVIGFMFAIGEFVHR
jgi:hypothetical protein